MALARSFKADTFLSNEIGLNWIAPLGFNNTSDELILTRTKTHFPMELFNVNFPDRYTDSRPIEIFRGQTIVGLNPGTISVLGNTLTDTSATFPTNPSLAGRNFRASNSQVFKIVSNTSTSVTLSGNPISGIYAILPDFPSEIRIQENYEVDARTTSGSGFIQNLVVFIDNAFQIRQFEEDELVNLIFMDGSGTKFIVKSNTETQVNFFESATPSIGVGMTMLTSHFNSQPSPYIDNFKTDVEAAARIGTGLEDDTFYYYTIFTKDPAANVAEAEFSTYGSSLSTQTFALSTKDKDFGNILYNLWPSLQRELDDTGDLQDLMQVFGFQMNQLHSYINTYNLQDSDKVIVTAALPLSEQTGLPSIGFSIGADTLRRVARNLIKAWELKGSKEGIALFIRIITTWDITNGTGDFSGSISDFLPNVMALRFFDPTLGDLNTRLTSTDPFVAGGRFAKSLPGIVIPGFFTFREFVVTLPNVALYIGTNTSFSVSNNTTTMFDSAANFGATDSLVGNFLLPNTDEVNDIFQIIGNTSTSITVQGVVNNRSFGNTYAVLSPLNTNRFIILNRLLPVYIPFGTRAGFLFTIS